MNILQIQYLLDAVETHSLHKSAERCNISPQGMSKAIRSLEEDLGIELIHRSTKGVYLTEAGEALEKKFREILQLYQEIGNYCNLLNEVAPTDSIKGEVKMAVTTRFGDSYLGKVLSKFSEKYPKIKIYVETYDNFRVIEEMIHGKTDATLGIVTMVTSDLIDFNVDQYAVENNLHLSIFYTAPMYQCGTVKMIQWIKERLKNNEYIENVPIVSYRYGDTSWTDSPYQVNSISAQKDMIVNNAALGTYTLEEFDMHFNKKRFAYIPFDEELTLNYGYLKKEEYCLTQAEEVFLSFLLNYFNEKNR